MIQIEAGEGPRAARVRFLYEEDARGITAFDGSLCAVLLVPGPEAELLAGLGSRDRAPVWPAAETPRERLRRAAAAAARAMRRCGFSDYAVECETSAGFGEGWIQEVVLGILLGLTFPGYRREPAEESSVHVTLRGGADADAVREAVTLGEAVCRVRSLGNMPANLLTPADLADTARDWGARVGFETEILEPAQIEALGMGAFLAVGQSAAHPPRLIVLRYQSAPHLPLTALVGKGVTCDTGGYCLKESASMTGIKGDMCGGAAVLGAVRALAENRVPANVAGIIPACENRIAPDSLLPGDVVRTMSGRTVEVLNTDAEGRLILCDAVTYAVRHEKAARVVDVATLTGAAARALGFRTAAMLSNDDAYCARFLKAAERAGERYWRLPAEGEYRSMLDSGTADLRNAGEPHCGAITAGIFIGIFAEGLPWIHLDIAGTAWTGKPEREDQSAGATGAGTASLYHLLKTASF